MRRIILLVVSAALLISPTLAQQNKPDKPDQGNALATLRKKAEAAEGGDRAKLYAELARAEINDADAKFTAGYADAAQAQVKRAAEDASEATHTALTTRKRLKQTQIAMHELARRLDGIEHSLSFEDRPQVKAAVDRLQSMATQLLEAMFTKK